MILQWSSRQRGTTAILPVDPGESSRSTECELEGRVTFRPQLSETFYYRTDRVIGGTDVVLCEINCGSTPRTSHNSRDFTLFQLTVKYATQ